MGNGITLRNPVVNSVPPAIAIGKKGVDENGRSLSTGLKANIDVVSSFLGNGLADKAKVLSKVLESMGYSSNVLRVTQDSLASMATTLSDMLALASQNGGSETAIRSLNDILQQKLEQLETQIKTADFDGRKLLGGDLGSDSSVRSNFTNKAVSVRTLAPGFSQFLGEPRAGTATLKIENNAQILTGDAGDRIQVGGVSFKFIDAGRTPDYTNFEVVKGTNEEETARNLATSIRKSGEESLQSYGVKVVKQSVILTPHSGGSVIFNPTVSVAGSIVQVRPSTQSLQLTTAEALPGTTVDVGGVKFTFQVAANGATTVAHGANANESMNNLEAAIRNHPTLKSYIDQGALVVTRSGNSSAVAGVNARQSITFQQNFETKAGFGLASNVANTTIQDGSTNFVLTFANAQRVVGDRVTIDGIPFTYVAGAGAAGINGAGQPQVGASAAHSATSLKQAIDNNPVLKAKYDVVDDAGGGLTITAKPGLGFVPAISIPVSGTEPNLRLTTTAAVPTDLVPSTFDLVEGGIDVTGIRNVDGFINGVKSVVTVTRVDESVTARATYQAATRNAFADGGAANANDIAVVLQTTIDGKVFTGAAFRSNAAIGGTGLAGQTIVFTDAATLESFSVKIANVNYLAVAGDLNATTATAQANLAVPIQNFINGTVFEQTKSLTINTDAGEIVNEDGGSIGSVEGMTVSLSSTNFTNKKFSTFVVDKASNNALVNHVKFTLAIDNGDKTTTNFVLDNVPAESLVKGRALTLVSATTGDEITINIGEKGLVSLNNTQNYAPVSKAITAALKSSGSGLDVRVGLGFDDSLKVQIPDVSLAKIFLNKAGAFVGKLSVLTPADAKIAQEVLTNALNSVSSALSKVKGQSETIDAASTSLSSAIAVTKDAAASYLDTDLVEAASAFSAALKSILAAISTLQAGARVADAGLEIIKSAAQ